MPAHRHKRRSRDREGAISAPQLRFASALPQRISHPDVFSQPLAIRTPHDSDRIFTMAPLPPRRPAPAAPSIAMPTPVPTPTPTRTSARPISTRRTPSRPTHPLPPLPSEANMTKSIETESAQPQFYNADALKSLNANATVSSSPSLRRYKQYLTPAHFRPQSNPHPDSPTRGCVPEVLTAHTTHYAHLAALLAYTFLLPVSAPALLCPSSRQPAALQNGGRGFGRASAGEHDAQPPAGRHIAESRTGGS